MTDGPAPAPVALLLAAVAVVGANSLLLSPILTDVAQSLQCSVTEAARATVAFGLATAAAALAAGRRLDRVGPPRMLAWGLALATLAVAASACAQGWPGLALAQAVAGAASGVILPAAYALATRGVPATAAPGRLGLVLSGWSVALVLGVPAAAFFSQAVGWRGCYLVLAAALAVATNVAWRHRGPALPAQLDAGGAGYLALLRAPGMAAVLAAQFCFMAAFYGSYAFVGVALRQALGLDAGAAGLLVLAYGVGFGAATLADGPIVRRVGQGLLPLALTAVALTMLGLGPAITFLPTAALGMVAWGFTNHLALNGLILLVGARAGGRRGAALALNSAATYLAAMAGVAAMGPIFERAGFTATAVLGGTLVAVAALLTARAGRANASAGGRAYSAGTGIPPGTASTSGLESGRASSV